MAELWEMTTKLAEKSVACQTEFNAKLAEPVQKQLAMSEVVTNVEVCPTEIETLLAATTEKATEWIWVNSRLDTQKQERSRRLQAISEK
jgi:hypothetical protein